MLSTVIAELSYHDIFQFMTWKAGSGDINILFAKFSKQNAIYSFLGVHEKLRYDR